jgi:hypothetical protein
MGDKSYEQILAELGLSEADQGVYVSGGAQDLHPFWAEDYEYSVDPPYPWLDSIAPKTDSQTGGYVEPSLSAELSWARLAELMNGYEPPERKPRVPARAPEPEPAGRRALDLDGV